MKRFFSDFLLKFFTFLFLNLPVILVYFAVALIFKFPVLDELVGRLSENSPELKSVLGAVLYFIYVAAYYVILYLSVYKNNSARVAYINNTANESYSFASEVKEYFRAFFVSDLLASCVVSLISFTLLGAFATNKFFRVIFITQYGMSQLVGMEVATVLYALFTNVFVFFTTVISQYVWNKNRLGGKA
ncbi:MAG: hypothetical protein E7633_02795 [Ruminococcaceae bacterium]|nr:hypothetical protein [Oscillospiraceae bacterium]